MGNTTEPNVATVSAETRVERGFWARFWDALRNSLGGAYI